MDPTMNQTMDAATNPKRADRPAGGRLSLQLDDGPDDEPNLALDLTDFAPRTRAKAAATGAEATRRVAEAAGFRSREPVATSQPRDRTDDRPPRRRRTGRNAQLNIKARPETVAAFAAIADRMGWGFGETLEHAVALLEREHGRTGDG